MTKNYFLLLSLFDIITMKEGDYKMALINEIIENSFLQVMLILVALDSIFGIFRAIRERSINSNIGIDGIIRKVLMIISVVFFMVIDHIMKIDLICFIPETIKEFLHIDKIGIGSLFNLLFILFEILSIFKNMIKCKLPIPKKLQKFLEKIFKEFTNELEKEKKGE